jgi:hypothetical protein
MSSLLAFLKYPLIVCMAYFVYYPPPEYIKATWQVIIAHFSAILTSEAALLNPFQSSIYPTTTLRPESFWPSKLLAHAGDCCLAVLDFIVYSLTRVRPARWELSRKFDHFPGHQDSL